ncbi:MAG TPA: beta-ketoacyl-ACP synthase II [Thermomicrobiales bacterium]|jgi:3-oxoacyl-[acyl-carrier-protein] synthase II|nr:beta-ketoacyl-ACP synthase II [Thermomicrobiales bacterium]
MRQDRRRVVITGQGCVGPLGNDVPTLWAAVRAGQSGVAPITRFDTAGYETTFAAEVRDFDAGAIIGRKEARRMDRFSHYAVAAALEAVRDAGLEIGPGEAQRVGVISATAVGGLETIESGMETLLERGPSRLGPFVVPMMLPNMASGNVAIAIGASGPNYAPVSACASAAHAIGEAAEIIRRGDADVVIAGGSEAPVTRLSVAGFSAMGALSRRDDDPAGASRPFDAGRDGFVLGEGGAMLVLESEERALGRDARILGELTGYAMTDDAHHLVQPAPGGEGAVRAMRHALASAGLTAAEIDYVNAHGTSTPLNEKLETIAIRTTFDGHADTLPVSSTKSMTGHLLGAAGSIEAVISLCAMRDGVIPPTINYQTPDPDCQLDVVPNVARPATLGHVMSNSLGFGGHNVSLIFSRYVP